MIGGNCKGHMEEKLATVQYDGENCKVYQVMPFPAPGAVAVIVSYTKWLQ